MEEKYLPYVPAHLQLWFSIANYIGIFSTRASASGGRSIAAESPRDDPCTPQPGPPWFYSYLTSYSSPKSEIDLH
jgi:hypothetical protein